MPIADLLSQITGEPSPTQFTTSVPPKRKADKDLLRPLDKTQKTVSSRENASRPVNQMSRPTGAGPSPSTVNAKPNGQSTSHSSIASPAKNGQLTSTPPPRSSNPPKKGSYAEIMARGKAAQAYLGQVGKIQHKPIQKPPNKRELEHLKARKSKSLEKALGPDSKFSKFSKSGQPLFKNGRNGVKETVAKAASVPVPEKKVKKAALATTGYSGTARPKPGSSTVPSRPSGSSGLSRPGRDRNGRTGGSSARYGYASEEDDGEEDEEDDEGNDYESDVSSDMEAAVYEVDEEEELAARIARKEDAEALAEENRLKREKEEKKRRLVAMAAKARRK